MKNSFSVTKLPTKVSENLNNQGFKKPLTALQAILMYDVDLQIHTFQKAARIFYKTQRLDTLLYLTNEITRNYIRINFTEDTHGYISIYVSRNRCELQIKTPLFNSHLFRIITARSLL